MKTGMYGFVPVVMLMACTGLMAQVPEKVMVQASDPHELYRSYDADSSHLFYLKLVPEKPIRGVVVVLPGAGETLKDVITQTPLPRLAVKNGLLVVLPSVNWGTSTFLREKEFLDVVLRQVASQHGVSPGQFVFVGFSGGAMLGLRYAEMANENTAGTFLKPRAIIGIDPPLDYAHLWLHSQHDVERNVSEAAVAESKWILESYRQEFGGSPQEVPAAYRQHSIFSHDQPDGGNARYLLTTPIRLYTEPDVAWQLKNRQRDFYDMNAPDISALINLLQLKGNRQAELVVTHNKGIRPNGVRHPHSWSIMEPNAALNWILQQFKK